MRDWNDWAESKAEEYIFFLSSKLPGREVGSLGNQRATEFFAAKIEELGFETTRSEFTCIDWLDQGSLLSAFGEEYPLKTGPYSIGCNLEAGLAGASTLGDLEHASVSGKILLLRGELVSGQLMPKRFPFYNPDEHRQLIELLEAKRPAAVLAATGRDPSMAGALSPFPLIEDGDFDIPSAYLSQEQGDRLALNIGKAVKLEIRSSRVPAKGWNVTTHCGGQADPQIICCAHIDAKRGSPGAIDNASGVVVLLLLAELLASLESQPAVEIVALNGEDYYAASGEIVFLEEHQDRLQVIKLGINIDGVGYHEGRTAFSVYGAPTGMQQAIREVFERYPNMMEGPQWFQSDHSMFLMNDIPALALTSERFTEIWTEIAHTEKDTPEIIDSRRIVEAAQALCELVMKTDQLK